MIHFNKMNHQNFIYACNKNRIKTVKKYLKTDADPSINNNEALILSCNRNFIGLTAILLEDKRIISAGVPRRTLQRACRNAHWGIVELLMKHISSDGYSLKWTCKHGQLMIVKKMLATMTDPNLSELAKLLDDKRISLEIKAYIESYYLNHLNIQKDINVLLTQKNIILTALCDNIENKESLLTTLTDIEEKIDFLKLIEKL